MEERILIIDDEDADRKAMRLALKKAGYDKILTADSAQLGLDLARSSHPDIILIDVVLKEVDGFDVCTKIKAEEKIQAKIIMITGHLDAINAEKARKSGADEILEKTPSFENINKTIKNLILKH